MPLVRRFRDAADFGRCVMSFLSQHEAGNTLPLRIIGSLLEQPGPMPPETYLAACFQDATRDAPVLGAALRTPPHNLVLTSPCPAEALAALLADTSGSVLPGVIGPAAEAESFASGWCAKTRGTASVTMRLGVYALEQVIPTAPVLGRLRAAVPGDVAFVQEWLKAFHEEATPHAPPPSGTMDLRGHYFWEVGGAPVTSVSARSATPHGAVINAVYTPPALRRRGYATATVAAASAIMLAEGHRFCFLFTDLANPTSNGIYQRIGYRFIGEFRQIGFTTEA